MLRVQSFSQSWDVAFHLSPEINAKEISSCSAFPSVCSSATMPSHSGVHFRMVVKPGTRPDFLENIFTSNIIFVLLREIINTSGKKSKKKFFFFITRPHYFTGSGKYRVVRYPALTGYWVDIRYIPTHIVGWLILHPCVLACCLFFCISVFIRFFAKTPRGKGIATKHTKHTLN